MILWPTIGPLNFSELLNEYNLMQFTQCFNFQCRQFYFFNVQLNHKIMNNNIIMFLCLV